MTRSSIFYPRSSILDPRSSIPDPRSSIFNVARLALRMSAAAYGIRIGIVARGHAVTAAISRACLRGTTADRMRAFVRHAFHRYGASGAAPKNSLGRHQPIPTKVNACLVLPCFQERMLNASPQAPAGSFYSL